MKEFYKYFTIENDWRTDFENITSICGTLDCDRQFLGCYSHKDCMEIIKKKEEVRV